jgi:hypothetical protein
MRNQRITAARSVADRLFEFEKALDDAFALGSHLSSRIVTARIEARLSAVLGQDAIDGVVRTLMLMADARRELIGTHHHLKALADEIGLREVSWGDLGKGPTGAVETDLENENRRLQIVA